LIENKTISLDDGLSFSTNQNNLLLHLKGLSSTEDFLRGSNAKTSDGNAAQPTAIPAAPNMQKGTSMLNMIE
jgi:hypothetical protein